jgi:sortase A
MPDTKPKLYLKDESFDPIYKSVSFPFLFRTRILSGGLMALGFLVLGTQVALPLVYFKTQNKVAKPMEATVLGLATGFSDFSFTEIKANTANISTEQNVPEYFYISIPKLKIENATVKSNFEGLKPDDFIGHYKGSALPGQIGNSYLFGHSVLPWFYNPKNYKTVFSTLGDLKQGDEIYLTYNNNRFVYVVDSQVVLKPENVKPLETWKPKYLNESTITLMTCWPAGTKIDRLEVRAILEK